MLAQKNQVLKSFYRLYQFKRIKPTKEKKHHTEQFRPKSYNKYNTEKQSIEFQKQFIDNSCNKKIMQKVNHDSRSMKERARTQEFIMVHSLVIEITFYDIYKV